MTKQEFEKRIGAEISQKDYSIVEHVYTWHAVCRRPGNPDRNGIWICSGNIGGADY